VLTALLTWMIARERRQRPHVDDRSNSRYIALVSGFAQGLELCLDPSGMLGIHWFNLTFSFRRRLLRQTGLLQVFHKAGGPRIANTKTAL
jgi:hypothetical protein